MRRRLIRFAVFALTLVILMVIGVPVLIGATGMSAIIHAPCNGDYSTPKARYNLDFQEIKIPSRLGGVYRGFFIPGVKQSELPARNTATIIFPAVYNGGASLMMDEAGPLASRGYNVVLYESRICVGRVLSLGYRDFEDIEDVIAYLETNQDGIRIDLNHIALHGFSSGGAASIMAAARDPRIRAVLAEGGYHRLDEYLGVSHLNGLMQQLFVIGIKASYRLFTGDDSSVLNPLDAITRIPPRPIFLIYGSREITLNGARQKLEAVRTAFPDTIAELWVVPGSGHGGYVSSAGIDEYLRQALAFYDCALLDSCAAWRTNWKR